MENNNTNNTPKMEIQVSTPWVDRILLGSLVAITAVATAVNIYSYFAKDEDTDQSVTPSA